MRVGPERCNERTPRVAVGGERAGLIQRLGIRRNRNTLRGNAIDGRPAGCPNRAVLSASRTELKAEAWITAYPAPFELKNCFSMKPGSERPPASFVRKLAANLRYFRCVAQYNARGGMVEVRAGAAFGIAFGDGSWQTEK
jgi:hypothetical protein